MSPPRRPIQILPEAVIHKIAAGEVVERPVSVVKELVENAIDAGSTRIQIQLEQGGLKSILVTDDGCGIPPRELPLALTRHATSKLNKAEDLFFLQTLGFRGEALPSIASVSDFRIESATEESAPQGYAFEVRQNKVSTLMEAALPRGTRIAVENLFCTTPARLKFMKRPETEWGHVYDLVTAMALSHLSIQWELLHNGKRALFCPIAPGPQARVLDLLGKEVAEALYPLEREVSGIRLHGLIGHPNFSKKTNRNLFVFVNGRYVQDRLIQHAILTGYRGLLMTQQYPVVILYLELDPAQVDVNVHPTKREVRFSNSQSIHHLISETLRHALEAAPWREKVRSLGGVSKEDGDIWETPPAGADRSFPTRQEAYPRFADSPEAEAKQGIRRALEGFFDRSASAPLSTVPSPQAKIGTLAFSDLQVIGQFNRTFLVCANGGSLILIDQHAAHERIGFEQLKRSYLGGSLGRQGILQPIVFELPEGEAQAFRQALPSLEKFAFEVEEFGERSFALKSHPTLLGGCDWVSLLREVASDLREEGDSHAVEGRIEHVLATMACHRQVRAGDGLGHEEMRELLRQLEGTPRSYHCPHGRPVMVEIESREIERWFKRIV